MKCTIDLQIDTTYILDLMFSIINIYISTKSMYAQIQSQNICTYDIPHTKINMESFVISVSFI
jgi:hypothetical protein